MTFARSPVLRRPVGRQAGALALSALVTLAVMGSIERLAVPPAPDSLLARGDANPQLVVIEGKRLVRG